MDRPELSLRTTRGPDQWVVIASGDLDVFTAPALEHHLVPLLRQPGTVTLDLREVDFLDLAAIGTLVHMNALAEQHRSTLIISAASACVWRLLNITGLASTFNLNAGGPPPVRHAHAG
jgi:anti-anti-sigma factor